MKITKLLILSFLSTGCPDNFESETESINEPICGNWIEENEEECDDGTDLCVNCKLSRRIVISSHTVNGLELGQNINTLCDETVREGDIQNNKKWRPWISTEKESANEAFFHSDGVYTNIYDSVIAYSWQDLTDGSINSLINIDQFGNTLENVSVWTGTNSSGNQTGNCLDWTTDLNTEIGIYGNSSSINKEWTNSEIFGFCSEQKHFYCIESEIIE